LEKPQIGDIKKSKLFDETKIFIAESFYSYFNTDIEKMKPIAD